MKIEEKGKEKTKNKKIKKYNNNHLFHKILGDRKFNHQCKVQFLKMKNQSKDKIVAKI